MNPFVQQTLKQIELAVQTTIAMLETLDDSDLKIRPTANKHSIGELVTHLATIPKADLLLANGSTKEAMDQFYQETKLASIRELTTAIETNYDNLKRTYLTYSEEELQLPTTSYWGVSHLHEI